MERREDFGAFMERFKLPPPPHPSPSQLPLHGLTFAIKDIFDISGYVTGFGNPDWARTHATAVSTAPAVLAIIKGGATCIGKTVMDEMAYSINGENIHYGTPTNPCTPDRVPGGSSSGSAVAVAAELVDFSIGTDTGGSVRVPAAYCGIFGFRPSHAVVDTEGVIPMAQSFDTVGWFARDPIILSKVGHILLQSPPDTPLAGRIIIPNDCFHILSFPSCQISEVLTKSIEKIFGHISSIAHVIHHTSLGDYISNKVPSLKHFTSQHNENQESTIPVLLSLSNAMRLLQRYEFKNNHGEWVNNVRPDLGPGISERVWEAVKSTENSIDLCHIVRSELRAALNALLEKHGVLALPTIPGPPPKLLTKPVVSENFRARAFSLLAIAGMSGFCQVTVPLGMHDNVPVSISFLARHGADHFLLDFVQTLYGTLREQASISGKLGC